MAWTEVIKKEMKLSDLKWYDLVAVIADLLATNIADSVEYERKAGEDCSPDDLFDSEYSNFTENLDWEMGKLREEICEEAKRRLKE